LHPISLGFFIFVGIGVFVVVVVGVGVLKEAGGEEADILLSGGGEQAGELETPGCLHGVLMTLPGVVDSGGGVYQPLFWSFSRSSVPVRVCYLSMWPKRCGGAVSWGSLTGVMWQFHLVSWVGRRQRVTHLGPSLSIRSPSLVLSRSASISGHWRPRFPRWPREGGDMAVIPSSGVSS
jgi:hypothetical protein